MKIRNVVLQAKSKVRSLNRKEFLKTKENNLENVREMTKNAKIRKRFLSS